MQLWTCSFCARLFILCEHVYFVRGCSVHFVRGSSFYVNTFILCEVVQFISCEVVHFMWTCSFRVRLFILCELVHFMRGSHFNFRHAWMIFNRKPAVLLRAQNNLASEWFSRACRQSSCHLQEEAHDMESDRISNARSTLWRVAEQLMSIANEGG